MHAGHEYDDEWNKLKKEDMPQLTVYVFGAGNNGRAIINDINLLSVKPERVFFLDNNPLLKNQVLDGIEVVSLDQYFNSKSSVIIVSPEGKARDEIFNQLNSLGLRESIDYMLFNYFVERYYRLYLLYEKNYLWDKYVQISIVEACTLKCKYCSHTIPYRNKVGAYMTEEEARQTIDNYFAIVDYCDYFDVLGGEPLLSPSLLNIMHYIVDYYRDRIGFLTVTTNATIKPDRDLLELCKKHNIVFSISDYGEAVPTIKDKIRVFIELLEANEVQYHFVYSNGEKWRDFGFFDISLDTSYAIDIFNKCRTPCREIRLDRYYYCIMSRCLSENVYFGDGIEDNLKLSSIIKNKKKAFFEFSNGYCNNNYLEMCKHCRGFIDDEGWEVDPGIQLN